MKVTVCFGTVRVVVPCGNGDILIGDLIDKAVTRYKKATGKPSSAWVTVQYLKNVNDGGILDPDDRLDDVADDREQILAIFEEQGVGSYLTHHNGGDGSSGSSTNCESPDIYPSEDGGAADRGGQNCNADFEISSDIVPSGVSVLQVRRGSEPALNKLLPVSGPHLDPMKRWSTAVVLDGDNPNCSSLERGAKGHHSDGDFLSDREDGSGEERSTFSHVSRDSIRSSILANSDDGLPLCRSDRREPLGGPNVPVVVGTLVVIENDGCPLGIHVIPEYDESERDFGIVVQGIETGGKIFRDGRIGVGDRIVEINGLCLSNVNFHRAQDMFKMALYSAEIRLRVVKANAKAEGSRRLPPPVFPPRSERSEPVENGVSLEESGGRAASLSPSHPKSNQFTHNVNTMLVSNTRKIGKKYPILLTKGHNGLGFSITTRDNLAGVNCPIYVKNILPKGAAIEDGNLRAGDRLLQVNGVQMTGKSQDDAVSLLRNAPLGSTVKLIVSRQEPDSPKLPRQLVQPVERSPDDGHYFYWKQREILTFDIPLNDTGSAGLGVSVKGKTSTGPRGTTDLGIFVKSVIHGGAASKDGRLFENDQLIDVNGVSLLRIPNSQAMDTLRHVMHREGPNPGAITLAIARRVNADNKSLERQANGGRSSRPYSDTTETSIRSVGTHSLVDSATDSDHTAVSRSHLPGANDEERGVDKIEDKDLGLDCPADMFNPVIERITGLQAPRNESYYRACCDGWNNPRLPSGCSDKLLLSSSTRPYDDSVIIEDEYVHHTKKTKSHSKDSQPVAPNSCEQADKSITNPGVAKDPNSSFVSQVSLDGDDTNFDRDGFGRQSMSEKRNAQLDARNTDTWQRNKKAREVAKGKDNVEATETDRRLAKNVASGEPIYGSVLPADGPSSNLVRCNSADSVVSATHRPKTHSKPQKPKSVSIAKSNSLESLQCIGQGTTDSGGAYGQQQGGGRNAVGRGRGCNESFRAAVDRSYDAPSGAGEAMETLDEEAETGCSQPNNNQRVADRAPSLATEREEFERNGRKKNKRGILRNLGSVFKFGKGKKCSETHPNGNGKFGFIDNDFHNKADPEMALPKMCDRDADKSWEHKRNAGDQFTSNRVVDGAQRLGTDLSESAIAGGIYAGWSTTNAAPPPPSRHDRINQLRAQHQKKHSDRQGHYPLDDKEERLQWQVQEKVQEQQRYDHAEIKGGAVHSRSHSYDMCQDGGRMTTGRSATASSSSTSNKYGHYVNYEEIQEHIRRQEQNLSAAARPPVGRRDRPISNYYEYESLSTTTTYNSNLRPAHLPPPPLPPALVVVPHHAGHRHNQLFASSNHGSLRGYPSRPRDQLAAITKRVASGKNSLVHPIAVHNNNSNKLVKMKEGNASGSKV